MLLKRTIAREWLIFLVVLFLSPPTVAIYQWLRAPNNPFDPRFPEAAAPGAPPFDPRLAEPIPDQPAPSTPAPVPGAAPPFDPRLAEPDITAGQPEYSKPFSGIVDVSVYNPVLNAGALTGWNKRPLGAYLIDTALDIRWYFRAVFLTYPLFLFCRSIIWAIRALSRRT
jgi:hypothetical protein